MPKCILVDIDGTLSDPTHRLHFVTGRQKDWPSFFATLGEDGVHQEIRELVQVFNNTLGPMPLEMPQYDIVLCSGRPDNYRPQTERWLALHKIPYHALYMRPAGDFRPDDIVKEELLDCILADGYKPLLVVDDRPRVVAMWRKRGLTCLQCREWQEGQESPIPPGHLNLLVGPSRAGKTSMRKYMAACMVGFTKGWLSSDEIRVEMCGTRNDQSQNDRVWSYLHASAKTRLTHGLNTHIDATNITTRHRKALVNLVPGVQVTYWVINRDLPTKLAAAEDIPPEVIRRQDQVFRSNLNAILAGDNLPNVKVNDLRDPLP